MGTRGIGICRRCLMALAVLTLSMTALADGVFFPDEAAYRRHRERVLINEPEQKAVVLYRNGIEDLIISPRFDGPAARFAWIIPVPSRPKVDKVAGALFHEIVGIVSPPRKFKAMGTAGIARTAGVAVLERKQVGAYEVAVLQAGDASALVKWLKANRFAIPSAAKGPIKQHIKEKWTFVAARVSVPQAERGLRTGTLAPIRLTFPTSKPIYPLRMSALNPEEFLVHVYLVLPRLPGKPDPRVVTLDAVALHRHVGHGPRWVGTPAAAKSPTLARLVNGPCAIYPFRLNYRPVNCSEDLTFQLKYLRASHPRPAIRSVPVRR